MAFKLKYNTTNFPFKKEVNFLDDKTNPETKEEGKKMMRATGELRKTEELREIGDQTNVKNEPGESDYLDKREEYEYVPQSVRDEEKGKPVGDDSIEKGKEESKGDVDKTKTEKSEASRQSQNQDQMTDDTTLEVGGRRKRKRDIEESGYGV
tara:strand:+ start:222 stop:677 length:456 start_codon:yes stop_codon:yes gene_type:complete